MMAFLNVIFSKYKYVYISIIGLFLLTGIAIQQTVQFPADRPEVAEYGWDYNFSRTVLMEEKFNTTVVLNNSNALSQMASSGDGESWETAYIIEKVYFAARDQPYLKINNNSKYLIFQECLFDDSYQVPLSEHVPDSSPTIDLFNVSNVKFLQCEFNGFYEMNEIAISINQSSNVIIQECDFTFKIKWGIVARNSSHLLLNRNSFAFNDRGVYFENCTDSTYSENFHADSFSPQPSVGPINFLQGRVGIWVDCATWTIIGNQFEYISKGLEFWRCNFMEVSKTLFYSLGYAIEIFNCEEISIEDSTFFNAVVDIHESDKITIEKNRFYDGQFPIQLQVETSAVISANSFYYVEYTALTLYQSTSGSNSESILFVEISRNQFIECQVAISYENSGENIEENKNVINSKGNFYFGGIQDVWTWLVICYITLLSIYFVIYNREMNSHEKKLVRNSELLENFEKQDSHPAEFEINNTKIVPNQMGPIQVIGNIRHLISVRFLKKWLPLIGIYLLVSILIKRVERRHGYQILNWIGNQNGGLLYNVFFLDNLLFVWSSILLSFFVACVATWFFVTSLRKLQQILSFPLFPRKILVKRLLFFGFSILCSLFFLDCAIEADGNWILFGSSFLCLLIAGLYGWLKLNRMRD